ncbi:hypothetical protein PoMZ_00074 [Pyricularia oryzae]|uniref:Uncharacterized protein n=1 Tax=Pyricularia oryzae TaxID=318829 RepID=A0A4P7N2J3_PYROR|nr:hypothetical protein PoMZ_00074 [Pyricularia oryzae]
MPRLRELMRTITRTKHDSRVVLPPRHDLGRKPRRGLPITRLIGPAQVPECLGRAHERPHEMHGHNAGAVPRLPLKKAPHRRPREGDEAKVAQQPGRHLHHFGVLPPAAVRVHQPHIGEDEQEAREEQRRRVSVSVADAIDVSIDHIRPVDVDLVRPLQQAHDPLDVAHRPAVGPALAKHVHGTRHLHRRGAPVHHLLDLLEQQPSPAHHVPAPAGLPPLLRRAQHAPALEPPPLPVLPLPGPDVGAHGHVLLRELLARLNVPERARDEHVPHKRAHRAGHAGVVHGGGERPQAPGGRRLPREAGPQAGGGGQRRAEAVADAQQLGVEDVHHGGAVDHLALAAGGVRVVAGVHAGQPAGQRGAVEHAPHQAGVQRGRRALLVVLRRHHGRLFHKHQLAGRDALRREQAAPVRGRRPLLGPPREAAHVQRAPPAGPGRERRGQRGKVVDPRRLLGDPGLRAAAVLDQRRRGRVEPQGRFEVRQRRGKLAERVAGLGGRLVGAPARECVVASREGLEGVGTRGVEPAQQEVRACALGEDALPAEGCGGVVCGAGKVERLGVAKGGRGEVALQEAGIAGLLPLVRGTEQRRHRPETSRDGGVAEPEQHNVGRVVDRDECAGRLVEFSLPLVPGRCAEEWLLDGDEAALGHVGQDGRVAVGKDDEVLDGARLVLDDGGRAYTRVGEGDGADDEAFAIVMGVWSEGVEGYLVWRL